MDAKKPLKSESFEGFERSHDAISHLINVPLEVHEPEYDDDSEEEDSTSYSDSTDDEDDSNEDNQSHFDSVNSNNKDKNAVEMVNFKEVMFERKKSKSDISSPDYHPEEAQFANFRRIHNNATESGRGQNLLARFPNNAIETTKYTWWNFIPKNLYEQFHRLANFFFLATAALTLVPGLTNITPISSISPLLFVLGVSALKEAYDDVKRSRSDSEINYTEATALRNGEWVKHKWKNLEVGDIVKIHNNELFPADLLLINSSLNSGMCYIQTSNLDGETNLKVKQALQVMTSLKGPKQLCQWNGRVECEQPNKDLYNFDGRVFMSENQRTPLSLSNNQMLLRGCLLKNTDWIYGMVIFTGRDSKLRQNARDPPTKRSTLEKRMNSGLLSLFIFMFILSLLCTILSIIYLNKNQWYLELSNVLDQQFVAFLRDFASYLILYSYMIPISLYVSMELVKLAQTFLLEQDINMYDEKSDIAAKAKTSNLNEELGQIDFIFSDKTGTLTSNEMELVKCSIGGNVYSMLENVVGEEGQSQQVKLSSNGETQEIHQLDKQDLLNAIQASDQVKEFFTLLAVCHTVLPESDETDKSKIVYQASSPDEFALVQRAAQMGFQFTKRTFDTVVVDILGEESRFEILNMIEFTSNRKRMSVICKTPDGKIRLYCKGADSVILPRLLPEQQKEFSGITNRNLEYFAASGLRTLCCAYADLDRFTYEQWSHKFDEANSAIDDRKKKIEAVAEEIERNLELLGCTAIEDKLQEGVPEAIAHLRKANLKIWVLTGDKQETAINIGLSCRLLTGVNLVALYRDNPDVAINENTVKNEIQNAIQQVEKRRMANGEEFALVIEGESLKFCLDKGKFGIEPLFMDLALQCKTVVCCRVSPSQKRGVVKLVKKYVPEACTLAIGDGANDVSMIQEAHIGIGIFGKEGMQAAMNSDYAIAQFRFLSHLLLIHGRRSYLRTSKLVLYSFYKNSTLSLCLFWFTIFSLFSAQNLFDSYALAGFNVIFANFPILAFAILDQDVKAEQVFKHPRLYEVGQLGTEFSMRILWKWFGLGIFHSIIIFFGCYFYFGYGDLSYSGRTLGLWAIGAAAFTVVVLVVNLKVALETNYWTWVNWVAIFGTIAIWFIFSFLYTAIYPASTSEYWVTQQLWSCLSFWLMIILITSACLLPDLVYRYVERNYFYDPHHIIQEVQRKGRKQRKKLRKKGVVFQKPVILSVPLDSVGEETTARQPHLGYAFAEDDNTATALSLSIASLLKKKNRVKSKLAGLTRRDRRGSKSDKKGKSKDNNVTLII